MMLTENEFSAILITLKLAFWTVFFLLLIGVPVAWFINISKRRFKKIIEILLTLPLVLPPTVMGFYLLVIFKPKGTLSTVWTFISGQDALSFSFSAMVIGSTLVGLPFTVQLLQHVFSSIGKDQWEMALTLRATKLDAFFTVILPQAKRGILSSIILSFAYTMGQFGLLLMIGGNIPGKTRVLSIAIYDAVESLDFSKAHTLSLIMLTIAFICLVCVQFLKNKDELHE
jgi:molybdate transport system permease protein